MDADAVCSSLLVVPSLISTRYNSCVCKATFCVSMVQTFIWEVLQECVTFLNFSYKLRIKLQGLCCSRLSWNIQTCQYNDKQQWFCNPCRVKLIAIHHGLDPHVTNHWPLRHKHGGYGSIEMSQMFSLWYLDYVITHIYDIVINCDIWVFENTVFVKKQASVPHVGSWIRPGWWCCESHDLPNYIMYVFEPVHLKVYIHWHIL